MPDTEPPDTEPAEPRYRQRAVPAGLPAPTERAELAPRPESDELARRAYPELIHRLDAIRAAVAGEEAEVTAWYEARRTAARQGVAEADAAVLAAQAQVAVAREQVTRTDAGAAQVWRALSTRLTPRAGMRLGPVPEPAADPELPVEQPLRLVGQARARLDAMTAVNTLALWTYLLIAVSAGGCAAALASAAWGIRPIAVRAALLVLAPVLGLLPARLFARVQHAHLDLPAILLALAAGGIGTAAIALAH